MKEEIKKYFNINIYKLEEEKRKINDNYILYYDLLKEIKDKTEEEREKAILQYNQEREEREKRLKTINNNIELLEIEKNILYNNIIYLFYKNYHNNIINILNKYNNKNIGEKTKEKINKEIMETLEKDNIFSSVYFSFGQYSSDIYKIDITLYRTKEEKEKYSYNRIKFSFNLCEYYGEEEKEKYKNYYIYRNEKDYLNIINNNMLWENNEQYNYIEDARKEARKILKECKKSMEKVKKLIEEARKERKKHDQLLNNYKIHEFDNIKIEYNQTL